MVRSAKSHDDLVGRTLVSWVGHGDLRAIRFTKDGKFDSENIGAIARLVDQIAFRRIVLLFDGVAEDDAERYREFLSNRHPKLIIDLRLYPNRLATADIGRVYNLSAKFIAEATDPDERCTFNVASGLPFMTFSLMLLSIDAYPGSRALRVDVGKNYEDVEFVSEVTHAMRNAINTAYMRATHGVLDEAIPFANKRYVSKAMQHVSELTTAAETDKTHGSLIVAPKGCPAKEIADAIVRTNKRLVTLDCGTFSETSFAQEVFGVSKRGLLNDGHFDTLLLLDVDELSIEMQRRLAIALQYGWQRSGSRTRINPPESFKIVATASCDIVREAASGTFDHGLFNLFAVHLINVPALASRREDIRELAEAVLEEVGSRINRKYELSGDALEALNRHDWPLNEAELDNTLRRITVLAKGTKVTSEDVERCILRPSSSTLPDFPFGSGQSFDELHRAIEQHWTNQALQRSNHNQAEAARLLGVNYKTFTKRMKRLSEPTGSDVS